MNYSVVNGGVFLVFRLLFPYLILLLIITGYIYFRHHKLGPVILKVNRRLLTRYNSDSFFLILILAAASYFLARYELINTPVAEDTTVLGPYTYMIFYGALLLAVICREVEKPALREKGISSPRGFWLWPEIDSFRWSKNVLTINVTRGSRKRTEIWQVEPSAKKATDQVLKKMVPKQRGASPKKKK